MNPKLKNFLALGIRYGGMLGGGLAGHIAAGPAGLFAGTAVGSALNLAFQEVARDFVERPLSPRERERSSAAMVLAVQYIDEMLQHGYEIRHDDFARGVPGNRSMVEEILEGIMIAAQHEYEERKIPYLAKLYANIAFHPEIDRGGANALIRLAQSMSYRRLLLLSLFSRRELIDDKDMPVRVPGDNLTSEDHSLLQDIYDLHKTGLLDQGFMASDELVTASPLESVVLGVGETLYTLMGLHRLDDAELRPMVGQLWRLEA